MSSIDILLVTFIHQQRTKKEIKNARSAFEKQKRGDLLFFKIIKKHCYHNITDATHLWIKDV